MKTAIFLFTILLIFCVLSTCYYDSEEYLYPEVNNSCDTVNVTFSLSVTPILQDNCYECHSNSNAASHLTFKLQDYADVKPRALSDGSHTGGSLLGAINHTAGYKPMPYPAGSSKIPGCKIMIIQKWIDSGSPDN
jgi:hypothetical protein